MKFALFLCSTFAFAIAVESFWGEGETKNVLEDEPDIDIKAEASIFSVCLIFACENRSSWFFVMIQALRDLKERNNKDFKNT